MTDQTTKSTGHDNEGGPVARFMRATEIDPRLLGMVGALLLIWIGFHVYGLLVLGEGNFLTPRNLWNLSVQTATIGIMATGMVLVIIARHIDLSVGSMVGVTGMIMGLLQVNFLPQYLGLGHPLIWIITVIVGIGAGALIGWLNGYLTAYLDIPSFIVTLGGLLVWRSGAFLATNGRTISPVDPTFALLGGGPYGAVGEMGSWIAGLLACAGVIYLVISGRGKRQKHGFRLRPVWAEVFMAGLGCGVVIGAVLVVNAYPWPIGIVKDYVKANGITTPPEELFISHGFAYPVLILAAVGIGMTILMTSTRFGRYVFAIGGNPEAATLAGINTRAMTVKIFVLMGALAGLAGAVASARLNSATNALGTTDELYVIAAAVIGGTSLAGGVGTIYGAIIGALIMRSLQTGMVLIGFDTAVQNIVVGAVLVLAVYLDNTYRKRIK